MNDANNVRMWIWKKVHRFNSVDYDTHLFTLMMLKDAKELYQ